MRYEKGTFTVVPMGRFHELDAHSQAIFVWLCFHANQEGKCFPSHAKLQKETGLSRGTIIHRIEKMEAIGIIRKTSNKITGTSNIYEIVIGEGVQQVNTPCPTDEHRGVQGLDTNYIHITKSIEPNNTLRAEARDGIQEGKIYTPEELLVDKQKHIQILGLFMKVKGFTFENPKQQKIFISRHAKAARQLSEYPNEKIKNTIAWLRSNADFKWTLETVLKYIDEDLNQIKTRTPQNVIIS